MHQFRDMCIVHNDKSLDEDKNGYVARDQLLYMPYI